MKTKIKAGDKVRCISNTTTGPSIKKDDSRTFTVGRTSLNNIYLDEFPGFYFYAKEFDVALKTKEEMVKEIHDLTRACDDECRILSARIAYLEATGSITYDDTEFKVWQVLQEIKTMKDDVSKAKAIASIVSK